MNGRQLLKEIANMNVYLAWLLYSVSAGFGSGLLNFYFGGVAVRYPAAYLSG